MGSKKARKALPEANGEAVEGHARKAKGRAKKSIPVIPTGKSLIIVESPAKAKTINKYVGRNYIVEASVGHIKNLPKSRIASVSIL